MKKIILIIFLTFICSFNVMAEELNDDIAYLDVTLIACESTDDVWVNLDGETLRIRLIAYDKGNTSLSNEIDEFFCSTLKSANTIGIEYDIAGSDKYNRELVHIYVDGERFSNILLSKGYGQVNYVEGDYKYLDSLCEIQKEAIISRLGIWSTSGIEEKYCESNIDLSGEVVIEEESTREEEQVDKSVLYKMIFISSAILILLILIRIR